MPISASSRNMTVRAALQRSVDDGDLAGVLAMVWHQGRIVLSEAVGYGDITRQRPMARDAIFQIASMTKPIVSVAALQLVDEGVIRLDEPIARWMPEFGDLRVLNEARGALDHTHSAAQAITLDDLLTHRSGFGYAFLAVGPIAAALEAALGDPLHSTLTPDAWTKALAKLPLLSDPGERFIYGHSTEVLGCLIARIEGRTLGEILQRRVFDPLGMRDTAFYVSSAKRDRLAHMYRRVPTGLADVTAAPSEPPLFESGGGGLYSTADDYLAFARMLLGGGMVDGFRLLAAATCERMRQNQLTARQRTLGALGRADFFAHTGFGYGLEIVLDPAASLFAGAGSASWGGVFGTGWRADPTRELITLFFTQAAADISSGPDRHDPATETAAGKLRDEFEQAVFASISRVKG
jgi:CubicO group peptidase (beta-lactamase class C family)